jgi:phosphohistidine swiveling domain-containing protein
VPPSPPDPAADRYFADLTAAQGPDLGGKARSLVRLAATGLPTPPGFVVTDALFRALTEAGPNAGPDVDEALTSVAFPPAFLPGLVDRLAALGGARFSVRSSFAHEDEPGQIAAGIYESRIDVTAAAVPAAVRQVLRSAVAPSARAYALAHGQILAGAPLAVLIHRFVPGDAQGGAASWADANVDDPSTPAEPLLDVHAGTPTAKARATIAAAVRGLFLRLGPIEIEWVAAGDIVTFVQLRPFAPPAPPAAWSGWRSLPADETGAASPQAAAATWTWDAAHNPLPLSAAQAGLVQLVDERCRIGIRQRVIGGYLFWAPGTPPPERITPAQLTATVATLAEQIDAGRAALGAAPALEAALDFFTTHYQTLLGLLPPALRAARTDLHQFVAAHLPHAQADIPALLAEVVSKESIRRHAAADLARATTPADRARARADYLALFGDEATAWDVAAPTHREQPESIVPSNVPATAPGAPARPSWSAEVARTGAQLPADLAARWSQLVTDARAAVAAGEDDDWLYARIQAPVRHALLALGRRLVDAGQLKAVDDVFNLPLEVARAAARGAPFAPGVLQAHADRGLHAQRTARRDPPPLAPAPAGGESAGRRQVQGHGCGGHAVGPIVLRHGPRGALPPPDAILLATSLLPTELPLLQVAALVTETGGPLGHVATQARERGLPAVVGAAGALALFRDGDLAIVDGTSGVVRRA